MSLSLQLVESLLAQRAAGLDAAARHKTVMHVLDNVGVAIAGREKSPIASQVRAAFGDASILSPASRAFVASAHAHMLDFDDVQDIARVHPTSVTLPAAAAVAPISGASGSDLVDAVALSNELMCRLGLIWLPVGGGPGADWFLTQLFGYFGAALAAGMVLRLNSAQLRSAMGLAYMQAAGGKEAGVGAGGTARAIYPAFAAMGGVQAALLARSGVEGPATALDGDTGFFRLYFGRQLDHAQASALLTPGTVAWQATQIKPWPSCRHSHPYIFAAQGLRPDLDMATVERISVRVNRSTLKLCLPLEQRCRPATLQDAKYSIPFMVAFSLVHAKVDLLTLNDAALEDPGVLQMAQRVVIDTSGEDKPGLPHARITLQTRGPRKAEIVFDAPFEPQQPDAAIRAKFDACLAYAGFSKPRAAAARKALARIDETDCRALLDLLGIPDVAR